MTVYRILIRHGLMTPARRRRGRKDYIAQRLTKPRSPTTAAKVERFHLSRGRELLDEHPPFACV
jgi:hypothetical protein